MLKTAEQIAYETLEKVAVSQGMAMRAFRALKQRHGIDITREAFPIGDPQWASLRMLENKYPRMAHRAVLPDDAYQRYLDDKRRWASVQRYL